MTRRSYRIFTFLTTVGLALPAALAQPVQEPIVTTDNGDPFGAKNTDAGVSVNSDAIVSTSNMRLSIFGKTGGTALETHQVGDNGFPFKRAADPNQPYDPPSRFFDPRTVYDPENDRLWVIYSEDNVGPEFGSVNDAPFVHVAVSREMTGSNVLDSLGNNDWWYYTGKSGSAGNGGLAFDFSDDLIDPFRTGGHAPYPEDDTEGIAFVDLPTIAVDDRAAYITGYTSEWEGTPGLSPLIEFSAVMIIPLSHDGGTKSILDGERPDEDDFVIMRFDDLSDADEHLRHYAVQEPYADQQADNAQFFVSISEGGAQQNAIRMGGLWYNSTSSEWEYSQRIVGGTLTDMPVGTGNEFFYGAGGYLPETPDTGFSPNLGGGFISSAVLAEDNNGDLRIFAAHHTAPSDNGSPAEAEEQWVIQWYVIDPHLDEFYSLTAGDWDPEILETGRIDGGGDGDFYHPVIGVTRDGVAYIEYTYSDGSDYPRMERVKLTSDYSAVDTTTAVEDGAQRSYELGGWADFSDMQADPDLCKLWSVHTLVSDVDPGTGQTDKRDIWLFEMPYSCFTPDMNGNSMVESGDAALYNTYYDGEDPRADANGNGEVDVYDMLIFLDAYSAGTP